VAAPGPGRGQPGTGPFSDEVAFELGQGGKDMEDELAAGGAIASWRLRNPMPRSARPVMISTIAAHTPQLHVSSSVVAIGQQDLRKCIET
jgi:hypothetical protein